MNNEKSKKIEITTLATGVAVGILATVAVVSYVAFRREQANLDDFLVTAREADLLEQLIDYRKNKLAKK